MCTYNYLNGQNGGISKATIKVWFQDAGITGWYFTSSIYMGHCAVSVPDKFARRVERIIYG